MTHVERAEPMATALDRRRMRDGESAMAASEEGLQEMDLAALKALREEVRDGCAAMQSLDDLGSKEANDAAWQTCIELEEKYKRIKAELVRRGEKL